MNPEITQETKMKALCRIAGRHGRVVGLLHSPKCQNCGQASPFKRFTWVQQTIAGKIQPEKDIVCAQCFCTENRVQLVEAAGRIHKKTSKKSRKKLFKK